MGSGHQGWGAGIRDGSGSINSQHWLSWGLGGPQRDGRVARDAQRSVAWAGALLPCDRASPALGSSPVFGFGFDFSSPLLTYSALSVALGRPIVRADALTQHRTGFSLTPVSGRARARHRLCLVRRASDRRASATRRSEAASKTFPAVEPLNPHPGCSHPPPPWIKAGMELAHERLDVYHLASLSIALNGAGELHRRSRDNQSTSLG